MLTSLKRVFRSGFNGFWRNAFVSFTAIFVITVTLLVVGASILFKETLTVSLEQIQNKVDINVYMVTTAKEADVLALKNDLEQLPEVKEVTYTSREDALAQFRERHENDETILSALEELDDNPLGASLSIRAKQTSQYEGIAAFLKGRQDNESPDAPLIYRANFNQNKAAIDKLTSIISSVQRSTYVAMIVLVLASVLIAFNTIRLAIYTSREEIQVMRLVGASNMHIRGPFIIEGVLYGAISGIVALLILYPAVRWLQAPISSYFQFDILRYFMSEFPYLFFVLVGAGIVLGVISSVLAVARYLRT
jgi:cell division transport system permease protein